MSAASSAGKRSPAISSNGPTGVTLPPGWAPLEPDDGGCVDGAGGGGGGGGGGGMAGSWDRKEPPNRAAAGVQYHRLQPVALLLQLQVQLADDLHLDAGLGRRVVAVDVVRVQMAKSSNSSNTRSQPGQRQAPPPNSGWIVVEPARDEDDPLPGSSAKRKGATGDGVLCWVR
uniref:Uncharacterized protein n=1 Tax=Anopheles coluzzii TaxID=1518534 RepID=A0A8W7PLH4_ANOCL